MTSTERRVRQKALAVRCPLYGCRADVGEPCLNLAIPVFSTWQQRPAIERPHQARRELGRGRP